MNQKSKAVAALLCFFLGALGVHRFYLGKTGSGIAILVLSILGPFLFFVPTIVVGIWVLIDFIMILCGSLGDYNAPNNNNQNNQ